MAEHSRNSRGRGHGDNKRGDQRSRSGTPARDERRRRDGDKGPGSRSGRGQGRDDRARRTDGENRPTVRRGEGSQRRTSRPGQASRADRPSAPEIPEGITGQELPTEVREELRGLSRDTAERVARHLAAAHLLAESEPESSLAHARFAARLGGRIGAVRESHGILAYRAGDFRTAARELRTALRLTGRADVLPMIADSERGMGRPERALDIAGSDDASGLGVADTIELMIVVAGAYADTGDVETALRTLEIPALRQKVDGRWQVRMWVAYADLLERAGRAEESRRWLTLAADADTAGTTGAAERIGRPAPRPAPAPSWADDEQIEVVDAYTDGDDDPDGESDAAVSSEQAGTDPDADAEPALVASADPGPEHGG